MNEEQNKSQVALAEEKILKFWKEQNIFQKSLQKDSPQGEFVFFDGPPYATGLPHYGHLLPGTMKDVIPRYKTMKGFHVPRQWGWDCHGLPIENLVQKELNLPTKQDIVEYGIEKFNQAAKDSVLRYEKDWKEYIPRVGRFVDMDNPYKTMDLEYMESVWAVFKNLDEKGLVYKSYKSMMVSPPLETVLSNQEVNMGGYKDITDISVYANFTLTSGPYKGANMVAWTTTPWTLPGNVLLAVGEEIEYVVVEFMQSPSGADLKPGEKISVIQTTNEQREKSIKYAGKKYIIAHKLLEEIQKHSGVNNHEILHIIKGKDLIGSTYEPIFPIYKNHKNAFRVVHGDFVTTEDGTGIVHIAPGFGQDDLNLGQKEKVKPIHHVKMDGHFVPEVENFLTEGGYDVKGWAVRNVTDHQHIDIEIVKYLARNGKLFEKKKYTHSYPVCWRTDCPLINYATESWFINVQKIKDKLIKNNQKTTWVPSHIKDGRFGKWLEEVRDWSVSRARFWGTPLPIWESESGKKLILGSAEELRAHTGNAVTKIIFVRHGQAEHNVLKMSSSALDKHPLTDLGHEQAEAAAKKLLKETVDVVYSSPILRAKQTAEHYTKKSGKEILFDDRLKEIASGNWEETTQLDPHVKEERDAYKNLPVEKRYLWKRGETGESWKDLDNRTQNFLDDIIEKHAGKTVAVFSHQGTGSSMVKLLKGLSNETAVTAVFHNEAITGNAVPVTLYVDTKRKRELDLHRPYIDEFVVEKDGETYKRIPDVFDVWFDSGSMPYASHHYPFDSSRFQPEKGFLKKTKRFPADFVAEGQDQTRGWFYVMMVLASAQFDQPAFKHVLVNGLVLAEDGKKMSKRLKNYPDLNVMIDSAGADALRLFLMASPAVHAEDVNFSERGVNEVQSKVMGRLRNSATFYEMYRGSETSSSTSPHVLDRWIVARLFETVRDVEDSLEEYLIDKGARPLFDFVDDLSTWYVRRSRDRFKGDGEDKKLALATTRFVLKEFAKVSAPFIPFVAEEVYQMVKEENDPESVHLCEWPQITEVLLQETFLKRDMNKVREICQLSHELRQSSNIKVRQPLKEVFVYMTNFLNYTDTDSYKNIIKEEINVKNIKIEANQPFDSYLRPGFVSNKTSEKDRIKEPVWIALDTVITEDLKQEGDYRELLRAVQDLRKKHDLSPKDMIILTVSENGERLVRKFEDELSKLAQIEKFVFEDTEGEALSLEDDTITLSITKN